MKTKLLLIISILFISISILSAQGNENAKIAPLPGQPAPNPNNPPPCIIPTPSIGFFGPSENSEISWSDYGVTGYIVYTQKNGSSVMNSQATVNLSIPSENVYIAYYGALPYGYYTIYVAAYNKCGVGLLSNPLSISSLNIPFSQTQADEGDVDVPEGEITIEYGPPSENFGDRVRSTGTTTHTTVIYPKPGSSALTIQATGIYPNPVSSTLNVSLPFDLSSSAKFLVNDISGRAINLPVSISSEGIAQIETSSISPGIYFLTVISGSNNLKRKFIKI